MTRLPRLCPWVSSFNIQFARVLLEGRNEQLSNSYKYMSSKYELQTFRMSFFFFLNKFPTFEVQEHLRVKEVCWLISSRGSGCFAL